MLGGSGKGVAQRGRNYHGRTTSNESELDYVQSRYLSLVSSPDITNGDHICGL